MTISKYSHTAKYYIYIAFSSLIAIVTVLLIEYSNQISPPETVITEDSASAEQLAAMAELEELLEQKPDDPDLNVQMANMLFDRERYQDAIGFYQKTLASDPKRIAAQIDLAICYYNLKIFDMAITELEKALISEPRHLKGLFNIGVMYYNTGQIEYAKQYWRQLIQYHPDSREANIAREIINSNNI